MFFNLYPLLMFFQPYFKNKYIVSIKPRIINISIDPSSLDTISSSFLHLLQITERTVFSKMYDILGFSNFLYLPQITQYKFFASQPS